MVCKTCRKLSFDLKEKNSKDLVAELRSKNPFDDSDADHGWDCCVDELERLLKVKEAKEILSGKGLGKRIFEKVRKVKK